MGHRQYAILCIDDDVQSLRVRKMLLESLGYSVLAESHPRRGLDSFGAHDVDAVVMDYQMPGMNGAEVALEMKRLRPDVPIVILSSLPWLPEDAPREAIDAFVQKGERLAIVADRLQQLIAARKEDRSSQTAAQQIGGAVGHFLGSLATALRKRAAFS